MKIGSGLIKLRSKSFQDNTGLCVQLDYSREKIRVVIREDLNKTKFS